MFEVTTLGQPLEVTKTTMAANRGDSFAGALTRIWGRGGVLGCKILLRFPWIRSLPAAQNADMFFLNPQSTKVLSPGPGSKPPPKAPSSFSSHPKANTMLAHSAPVISRPVSVEEFWEDWRRHTLPWVSVPA
jgi:hypothetical protein